MDFIMKGQEFDVVNFIFREMDDCKRDIVKNPPGVVGPWPPSGSPSVFILRLGKIGGSGFVSSNSENISCVTFLKHKNSRK
jgi:hypothetical protein